MNVLNCSKEMGTFLNDTTARINFYGNLDSISNLYNMAKRSSDGQIAIGDSFDYFDIDGVKIQKKHGREFYMSLWCQFLNDNKDLAEKVRMYDGYSDGIAEDADNSPARVFYILKHFGLAGLSNNCKGFVKMLREERKKGRNTAPIDEMVTFENLDARAKRIVGLMYGTLSKEDIIKSVRENNGYSDILVKLVDVRYDEKEENCTDTYVNYQIRNLKTMYERLKPKKGDCYE